MILPFRRTFGSCRRYKHCPPRRYRPRNRFVRYGRTVGIARCRTPGSSRNNHRCSMIVRPYRIARRHRYGRTNRRHCNLRRNTFGPYRRKARRIPLNRRRMDRRRVLRRRRNTLDPDRRTSTFHRRTKTPTHRSFPRLRDNRPNLRHRKRRIRRTHCT